MVGIGELDAEGFHLGEDPIRELGVAGGPGLKLREAGFRGTLYVHYEGKMIGEPTKPFFFLSRSRHLFFWSFWGLSCCSSCFRGCEVLLGACTMGWRGSTLAEVSMRRV